MCQRLCVSIMFRMFAEFSIMFRMFADISIMFRMLKQLSIGCVFVNNFVCEDSLYFHGLLCTEM